MQEMYTLSSSSSYLEDVADWHSGMRESMNEDSL